MKIYKILILLWSLALNIHAYDCVINGIFYNLNEDLHTASITHGGTHRVDKDSYEWYEISSGYWTNYHYYGYIGNDNPGNEVVIPSSIENNGNHYIVDAIGRYSFVRTQAEKIILPPTIKKIDKAAFKSCNSTSIILCDGIEEIGDTAFFDCKNITTINIPIGTKKIGHSAFEGCNKIIIAVR